MKLTAGAGTFRSILLFSILLTVGFFTGVTAQDYEVDSPSSAGTKGNKKNPSRQINQASGQPSGQHMFLGLNHEGFIKLYGGEMLGYQSYKITTPVTGFAGRYKATWNEGQSTYMYFVYALNAEKTFVPIEQSNGTLDSLVQSVKFRYGKKASSGHHGLNLNLRYAYRPAWPDLYQPNPLNYATGYDLNKVTYKTTDRYSTLEFSPEYTFARPVNGLPIHTRLAIIRKIATKDPNFDPRTPTHLTNTTLWAGEWEIGVKLGDKNSLSSFDVTNTATYSTYDYDLARDRIDGKTHYLTAPNPNYKELNDVIRVGYERKIQNNMEWQPYYAFEYNRDMFQGYETYYGNQLGMDFQHNPSGILKGNLSYQLGIAGKYLYYGPNSYNASTNHVPLVSGNRLYKTYLETHLDFDYKITRQFTYFTDSKFSMKRTNYPDYVPGVNPITGKNYDINFSYDNFEVLTGVKYDF